MKHTVLKTLLLSLTTAAFLAGGAPMAGGSACREPLPRPAAEDTASAQAEGITPLSDAEEITSI